MTEGRLRRLFAPVDIASLAAFRALFGALLVAAVARFFAKGLIHEYYEAPKVFFHYYGFEWVRPWPAPWMHVHYAVIGIAALFVAIGLFYRASAFVLFATFTYAHLCDKTNYLNHYYLVSLLALLAACLPLHGAASIDGRHRPGLARSTAPAWMLYLLRFQIGVVYVFGGLAKLRGDWLLRAQPLSIWLAASTDVPVLGRLFAEKWVAYAMSYAGAAFDLGVVPLLLVRRTRPFAYAALVVFHALTARLFPIGIFPWIMAASALLFFSPSWPRRFAPKLFLHGTAARSPRGIVACLAAYAAIQIALPLRHLLYPGDLLWTEEGFRFAWNVMLMEKSGVCELTVREPTTQRAWVIDGSEYLTRYQIKMMATQPDMILELAHVVADDFRSRDVRDPQVFASCSASLNGRPARPLIDPNVDLARERDGFAHKRWILPP